MENPDVGEVGNPVCGDVMRMQIRVSDNRIEDVKFKTFGSRRCHRDSFYGLRWSRG